MAKSSKTKSPLEKAMSHKSARKPKEAIGEKEMEVYVAWMQGKIDASQACYGLNITPSTFRGKVGSIIRDAIIREELELTEVE